VSDAAAYAPNWWRILLTDAALGLVAVVAGLARGGGFRVLSVVGAVYVAAVARRFVRWRRLRASRGR
jgi:hypothetical protein